MDQSPGQRARRHALLKAAHDLYDAGYREGYVDEAVVQVIRDRDEARAALAAMTARAEKAEKERDEALARLSGGFLVDDCDARYTDE